MSRRIQPLAMLNVRRLNVGRGDVARGGGGAVMPHEGSHLGGDVARARVQVDVPRPDAARLGRKPVKPLAPAQPLLGGLAPLFGFPVGTLELLAGTVVRRAIGDVLGVTHRDGGIQRTNATDAQCGFENEGFNRSRSHSACNQRARGSVSSRTGKICKRPVYGK